MAEEWQELLRICAIRALDDKATDVREAEYADVKRSLFAMYPNIFAKLHKRWQIPSATLRESLSKPLTGGSTQDSGRSQASFYFSADSSIVFKSMISSEYSTLGEILPDFMNHVYDNLYTLMPQYLGSYRLVVPGESPAFYVAMVNVLYPTPSGLPGPGYCSGVPQLPGGILLRPNKTFNTNLKEYTGRFQGLRSELVQMITGKAGGDEFFNDSNVDQSKHNCVNPGNVKNSRGSVFNGYGKKGLHTKPQKTRTNSFFTQSCINSSKDIDSTSRNHFTFADTLSTKRDHEQILFSTSQNLSRSVSCSSVVTECLYENKNSDILTGNKTAGYKRTVVSHKINQSGIFCNKLDETSQFQNGYSNSNKANNSFISLKNKVDFNDYNEHRSLEELKDEEILTSRSNISRTLSEPKYIKQMRSAIVTSDLSLAKIFQNLNLSPVRVSLIKTESTKEKEYNFKKSCENVSGSLNRSEQEKKKITSIQSKALSKSYSKMNKTRLKLTRHRTECLPINRELSKTCFDKPTRKSGSSERQKNKKINLFYRSLSHHFEYTCTKVEPKNKMTKKILYNESKEIEANMLDNSRNSLSPTLVQFRKTDFSTVDSVSEFNQIETPYSQDIILNNTYPPNMQLTNIVKSSDNICSIDSSKIKQISIIPKLAIKKLTQKNKDLSKSVPGSINSSFHKTLKKNILKSNILHREQKSTLNISGKNIKHRKKHISAEISYPNKKSRPSFSMFSGSLINLREIKDHSKNKCKYDESYAISLKRSSEETNRNESNQKTLRSKFRSFLKLNSIKSVTDHNFGVNVDTSKTDDISDIDNLETDLNNTNGCNSFQSQSNNTESEYSDNKKSSKDHVVRNSSNIRLNCFAENSASVNTDSEYKTPEYNRINRVTTIYTDSFNIINKATELKKAYYTLVSKDVVNQNDKFQPTSIIYTDKEKSSHISRLIGGNSSDIKDGTNSNKSYCDKKYISLESKQCNSLSLNENTNNTNLTSLIKNSPYYNFTKTRSSHSLSSTSSNDIGYKSILSNTQSISTFQWPSISNNSYIPKNNIVNSSDRNINQSHKKKLSILKKNFNISKLSHQSLTTRPDCVLAGPSPPRYDTLSMHSTLPLHKEHSIISQGEKCVTTSDYEVGQTRRSLNNARTRRSQSIRAPSVPRSSMLINQSPEYLRDSVGHYNPVSFNDGPLKKHKIEKISNQPLALHETHSVLDSLSSKCTTCNFQFPPNLNIDRNWVPDIKDDLWSYMDRIYDLKGTTEKRIVRKGGKRVLKDRNFQNHCIYLSMAERDILLTGLRADLEFLISHNLMDYSLLLGVKELTERDSPTQATRVNRAMYNKLTRNKKPMKKGELPSFAQEKYKCSSCYNAKVGNAPYDIASQNINVNLSQMPNDFDLFKKVDKDLKTDTMKFLDEGENDDKPKKPISYITNRRCQNKTKMNNMKNNDNKTSSVCYPCQEVYKKYINTKKLNLGIFAEDNNFIFDKSDSSSDSAILQGYKAGFSQSDIFKSCIECGQTYMKEPLNEEYRKRANILRSYPQMQGLNNTVGSLNTSVMRIRAHPVSRNNGSLKESKEMTCKNCKTEVCENCYSCQCNCPWCTSALARNCIRVGYEVVLFRGSSLIRSVIFNSMLRDQYRDLLPIYKHSTATAKMHPFPCGLFADDKQNISEDKQNKNGDEKKKSYIYRVDERSAKDMLYSYEDDEHGVYPVIIQFGLIDILQRWKAKKQIAHIIKKTTIGLTRGIDTEPPPVYGERFYNYMETKFQSYNW